MSQVTLRTIWQFELEPRDAALVLSALGGRLDTPEKQEAAKSLGDKLTLDRAKAARNFVQTMEQHEQAMERNK